MVIMTKPAAFQATFCDWKLIKGRKVVQIVFEVPLEGADEAYRVLDGMPDPGASVWCAIARLNINATGKEGDAHPQPSEPHKAQPASQASPAARADNRLVKQACICCKQPVFQLFLRTSGMPVHNTEEAAVAVRLICSVDSRSKIVPGSPAAIAWDKLYSQYVAWRDMPEASGT